MLHLQNVVRKFEMVTIPEDATVADAIIKLVDNDFSPLLVPRKNRTDAYGIVTKKDVIKKVLAECRDPREVQVGEIASKPLVIVNDLSMDVRWAAKMMERCKVSTLAVFDKGDFYGFVTGQCIIDEYFNQMRREKIDKTMDYVSC